MLKRIGHQNLLIALFSSADLKNAARKAGISYANARRIATREDFQREYKRISNRLLEDALSQLSDTQIRLAVSVLAEALRSTDEDIRLIAAVSILRFYSGDRGGRDVLLGSLRAKMRYRINRSDKCFLEAQRELESLLNDLKETS